MHKMHFFLHYMLYGLQAKRSVMRQRMEAVGSFASGEVEAQGEGRLCRWLAVHASGIKWHGI